MKNLLILSLIVSPAILAVNVRTAVAEDSKSEPKKLTSESKVSGDVLDQVYEKTYINLFTNYHGAPLNDLASPFTPDKNGKIGPKPGVGVGHAMYFDSTLVTAYKINEAIGVGPEINFFLEPVLGRGFTLNDCGLRVYDKHIIHQNGFNLYSNLIIQAPTSNYSKNLGMDVGLKTTPIVRYNIPASRFTTGAYTEAKAYVGVQGAKNKNFKLYAAPYLEYQLTPSVALTAEYEMEAKHLVGAPNFDFTNVGTDLEPGVKWNITSKIWINPYINLYTGDKVTWSNSSFGTLLGATL